jgi:hypothetical protein
MKTTIAAFFGLLVAGVIVASQLAAQAPSGPPRNRRVWTGTIDDRAIGIGEHDTAPIRRPVRYVHDIHVEFTYISEEDPSLPDGIRWISRRIRWTALASGASAITGYDCENNGEVDLGPSTTGYGAMTSEQADRFNISPSRCKNWDKATHWTFIRSPPTSVPLPVIQYDMSNCDPTRRWRSLGADYTLSVSRDLAAVVEVEPGGDYERFVPRPGVRLTVNAKSLSGPALFRFELDPRETSRFPGYATNANIDDVFFVKPEHNLGHLRGSYANDDPDVIFDAEHFGGGEWARRDRAIVETRTAQGGAVVTMTTMDYGAVGKLRAFAKPEDCNAGWQPATMLVGGQARDGLSIPLDEDDNLMADALEQYHFLDSDADDDAEPKGNGMPGDGLTAFEEYRGFVVRGAACYVPPPPPPTDPDEPTPEPIPDDPASMPPGSLDEHERTNPTRKDLFVHTPDPELVTLLGHFAWASDLSVHAICEHHYIDNDTRIMNFTLQESGTRVWNGKTVSQAEPQHGIWVDPVFETDGMGGVAVETVVGMSGPPKFTEVVEIQKADRLSRLVRAADRERAGRPSMSLEALLTHELGHAVGMPHHGNHVDRWRDVLGRMNIEPRWSPLQRAGGPIDFSMDPDENARPNFLLVEPGAECQTTNAAAVFVNGQFAGCLADLIVRRGQQNSGDMDCPMRYFDNDPALEVWYEPPDSRAVFRQSAIIYGEGAATSESIKVDVWGGRLRRYQTSRDHEPRGKFCVTIRGNGLNAPGETSHAGDVGEANQGGVGQKPSVEYLVVNDMAARGVP